MTKERLLKAIHEYKEENDFEFHAFSAIAWIAGYDPEMNVRDAYHMVNELLKEKVISY